MSTACVFNTVSRTVPGSNDMATDMPSFRSRMVHCTASSPSGSTFFTGLPVLTRYLTGVSLLAPADSPLCGVRRPTRGWQPLPRPSRKPRGLLPPGPSSRPGVTAWYNDLEAGPQGRDGRWMLWWRKRPDRRRIDLGDRRTWNRAQAEARTLARAAVLAASDPNVGAIVAVTYTQRRRAVIREHTDPDPPGAGHKDGPERICSDPTASAHEGCSPNTRASAQPRT